jgi:hypothetical protein
VAYPELTQRVLAGYASSNETADEQHERTEDLPWGTCCQTYGAWLTHMIPSIVIEFYCFLLFNNTLAALRG